jgi:dTDP-4-amino-4,6-dideoxygalactose transaminase
VTQRPAAPPRLDVDLATPEPIPEDGIAAATALMRAGTLFRYAEAGGRPSEAALWESEFAAFLGRRYAVAVNSCGAALYLALHCLGVRAGDPVLVNAWTLAPVPGAVAHAGARAVLLETTAELTVDLADLERKAAAHPGSVLLLSHMRGHIADLAAVAAICDRYGLSLVEDCAHSVGGAWNGRPTGTSGAVGCFSMQAYKHLNSGEGGMLVTDDDEIAARAILASGSYQLHGQHASRPPAELFDALAPAEPNHSMRLTDLAAALLRPQLRLLPDRVAAWNDRYERLARGLDALPGVRLPRRPPAEQFVGSSLQFFLDSCPPERIAAFCGLADELGVHVKWFGAARPVGFTSTYRSWADAEQLNLPDTDAVLAGLCDIRVPLALPLARCDDVVAVLAYALSSTLAAPSPTLNRSA